MGYSYRMMGEMNSHTHLFGKPRCGVVVCDLETSRIGAPYIYDIRSLRVNDLTLILLTWRKW